MRELIACWQSTRMIVLIGLCAAMYAAVSFMFSWLVLIPGLTQIRPAACLPIVFSIFFGPAAAWGSAFGNLLGDLISGIIGPGSLFGILGNFIYGYAPYRVLKAYSSTPGKIPLGVLGFAIVLSSGLCAEIISLGVQALGLAPFTFLGNVVLLNNIGMSVLLAPLLIRGLQNRIQQMRMSYTQMLEPGQVSSAFLGRAGAIILFLLALAVYGVMMWPAMGSSLSGNNIFLLATSILLTLASLILL